MDVLDRPAQHQGGTHQCAVFIRELLRRETDEFLEVPDEVGLIVIILTRRISPVGQVIPDQRIIGPPCPEFPLKPFGRAAKITVTETLNLPLGQIRLGEKIINLTDIPSS